MKILTLSNITKTFNQGTSNEVRVLRNLSLSLDAGESVMISGNNGSGKSTLLKIISGDLPPDSGEIAIAEKHLVSYDNLNNAVSIARISQNPALDLASGLSLSENLLIALFKNKSLSLLFAKRKKNMEVLKAFLKRYNFAFFVERLSENVCDFSGGQKQLIAFLMSIIAEPQILLLDEPTANLDAKNEGIFVDTLRLVREKLRPTIIIISHNLTLFNEFVDNRYLLVEGTLKKKEN